MIFCNACAGLFFLTIYFFTQSICPYTVLHALAKLGWIFYEWCTKSMACWPCRCTMLHRLVSEFLDFFFLFYLLFCCLFISFLLTEIVIHFDVAASRRIFLFLSGSYPTTFSFPFNLKFSRFAVCLFSVSWLNFSVLDAAIRVRGNDGVVCGYT